MSASDEEDGISYSSSLEDSGQDKKTGKKRVVGKKKMINVHRRNGASYKKSESTIESLNKHSDGTSSSNDEEVNQIKKSEIRQREMLQTNIVNGINGHESPPTPSCSSYTGSNTKGSQYSFGGPRHRVVVEKQMGSSSDSDETGECSEDECCVYTYKGFSGLMKVDNITLNNLDVRDDCERRRASSPEMDFLEMDFDPGQSNDPDCSSDSDCCDMDGQVRVRGRTRASEVNATSQASTSQSNNEQPVFLVPKLAELAKLASCSSEIHQQPVDQELVDETCCHGTISILPPNQPPPDDSPLVNISPVAHEIEVDPSAMIMIWNESEAEVKQVTSVGPPGKGVAAVLNALMVFGLDLKKEAIHAILDTFRNVDNCPLTKYLFMKSTCYSSHSEIAKALQELSSGRLISRFFATYPERYIALCSWLLFWIRKGAVPIVIINPQPGEGCGQSNGWQHRMVSGISCRTVHLTDPIAHVPESILYDQLSRPSMLQIPREDIISRWTPETDLTPLTTHPDQSWKTYNVLGQIVNIVREEMRGRKANDEQFVKIPTKLTCGILLIMTDDNPNVKILLETSELPVCRIR